MSQLDDSELVREELARSQAWRALEYEPVVTSTNAILAQRAAAGEGPGLVLVAEQQSEGRGRLDRRWEDTPGGSLAVSFLVTADFPRPTVVPLSTGVAVVDAIGEVGLSAGLKWPNDVLIRERKCCGILVEAVPGSGLMIIGVGLNIDWRDRQRAGPWTSLAEERGDGVDPAEVLAALLGSLEGGLERARNAPDAALDAYRTVCVTLGRQVRVELPHGVMSGEAEDVDTHGALLVATGERRVALAAGDVEHVRTL